MTETFVVPREQAGLELDEFLCLQYPEITKGFIRRQVKSGAVLVDGVSALPSQRLRTDQVLLVTFAEEPPEPPVAPGVEIPVLHEEEGWLVVDKPPGLAVEPERWARSNPSLAGALVQLVRGRGEGGAGEAVPFRLRLVHRIDKDTSGALLAAKDLEHERFFREAFEAGTVGKAYLALVEGEHPLEDGGVETIDLPLGPDARKSGRMVVDAEGGKPSVTRIEVAQRFRGYTLLRCEPRTGRTHQIRVHLSARGFPLAVDPLYGRRNAFYLSSVKTAYKPKRGRPERPLIDRLTLHAHALRVPRPAGGDPVEVEAPLPKDFSTLLRQLGKVRAWRR